MNNLSVKMFSRISRRIVNVIVKNPVRLHTRSISGAGSGKDFYQFQSENEEKRFQFGND